MNPAQVAAQFSVIATSLQITGATIEPIGQARYIYIRKNADANEILALAELRVLDVQGNNLALNRSISSSGDQGYAWAHVNNVIDGDSNTQTGIYISSSTNAWIRLDLGSMHNIGKIELIGRSDARLAQNGQFTLYASTADIPAGTSHEQLMVRNDVWRYREDSNNQNITVDAVNAPTSAPASLPQPQPVITQARYVYVRKSTNAASPLAIAELQVLDAYGNNLAFGKAVTSSTAHDAGWSAASNAVDGKSISDSGIFLSAGNSADWLQVDLGRVYDIAQIKVVGRTDAWLQNNGQYGIYAGISSMADISTSALDGQAGLMRYRVTGNPVLVTVNAANPLEMIGRTEDLIPTPAAIAEARYIYIRKNAGVNNRLSLAEVQVFDLSGSNLALGKAVSSSGAYDTGWFSQNNVVDGQPGTGSGIFASAHESDAWLQIDLGAIYRIGKIQVTGRSDANQPQDGEFTIYASGSDLAGNTHAQLATRVDLPRWVEHSNSVHVSINKLALPTAADPLGLIRPLINASDIANRYFYTGGGLLSGEIDPEGYLTEYRYDVKGRLEQSVRYASRVATPAITLAAARPSLPARGMLVQQSWDALDRLVNRSESEGPISAVGNGFRVSGSSSVVVSYVYDNQGNLLSSTSAAETSEARTVTRRYDVQGRLIGELSAQGAAELAKIVSPTSSQIETIWAQYSVRHSYDTAGRRTATVDQNGSKTLFFYNADSQLTHTVNALGEVIENRYDNLGQLAATARFGGRVNRASIDGANEGGLVSSVMAGLFAAARGVVGTSTSSYAYNVTGTLARSVDAAGFEFNYVYNTFRQESQRTQQLGAGRSLTVKTEYDRRGLQTQVVADPAGLNTVRKVEYDAFGRVRRSQDGNGRWTETRYDRLGRVIGTTDPLSVSRAIAYDAFDRVVTQTDGLGNRTTYTYDPVGRSITITSPEGLMVKTVQNRHGQAVSVVDANGNATQYAYDANGRLLDTSTPLTRTSNVYDRAGRLTDTVDANGNLVHFDYDAANRLLVRTVDARLGGLNLRTTYEYNAKGEQIKVTDPEGGVTQLTYNLRGELIQRAVDPAGLNLVTSYSYDGAGQTLTVKDPQGTVTAYSYDARGRRVLEVVDPATTPGKGLNLVRSYAYDANDNVVSTTDGNGHVTRYSYDANNRLRFVADGAGSLRETSYDIEGRVLKQVSYAKPIDVMAMGALGLALSEAQFTSLRTVDGAKDKVEHRVYDRDGRMTATVNGVGDVVRYTYDRNGNVILRTAYAARLPNWRPGDALPAPTVNATYQAESVRTVYDALNRATYTIDAMGGTVLQRYDGNGNITERIAFTRRLDPSLFATQPTAVEMEHRLINIFSQAKDVQSRFRYDAANRLSFSSDGSGAVTQYLYDKNGNLVQQRQFATSTGANQWLDGGTTGFIGTTAGVGRQALYALKPDGTNDALLGYVDSAPAAGNTALYLARNLADGGYVYTTLAADLDLVRQQGWSIQGTGIVGYIRTSPSAGTAALHRLNRAWSSTNVFTTSNAVVADVLLRPPMATENDRVTRKLYDKANRLVASADELGAVTAYAYDRNGNVIKQTRYAITLGTGYVASLASGQLAALTALPASASDDRVTRHLYDRANREIFTVDAEGAVTESYYDGAGQRVTTIERKTPLTSAQRTTLDQELAQAGTLSRSDLNKKVTPVAAADRTTRNYYDAAGRVVFTRDALGQLKGFVYDGVGRLVKRTVFMAAQGAQYWVDEGVTGYVGAAGAGKKPLYRLRQSQTGDHLYTTDATERANLLQSGWVDEGNAGYLDVAAASGNAALYRLRPPDASTNHYYTADPTLRDYAKNVLGWIDEGVIGYIGTAPAVGKSALYQMQISGTNGHFYGIGRAEIDLALTPTAVASANDQTEKFVHDAAGNLLSSTDADSKTESYAYDGLANKIRFINKKQSTWTYAYDAAGYLVKETSPQVDLTVLSGSDGVSLTATSQTASVVTQMAYDALGRLLARTEAVGRPEQRTTSYEYDTLGRQVKTTLPPVGVYSESPSDLVANGQSSDLVPNAQSGWVVRVETAGAVLFTETRYDALGNAVAGRSVSGEWSYKIYDKAGRVAYEVDAMKYVTRYSRDTWGEVEKLVRYALQTTLPADELARNSTSAMQNDMALKDASKNRELLTRYDRMGRIVSVQESEVFNYDSATSTGTKGSKTTSNAYDAFGNLVAVTKNVGTYRAAATSNVYDQLGRLVASKDALGYTTTMAYDAAGNVSRRVEYASAASTSTTAPNEAAGDRVTDYVYDRLNRKTAEIRRQVMVAVTNSAAVPPNNAVGKSVEALLTNTVEDLTTSFTYDAVGNLTSTTDALGGKTYSYYDALGRVTAVVVPSANTGEAAADNGAAKLAALTQFGRDAHGNTLLTTQRANGVVAASVTAYQAGSENPGADRSTLTRYDAQGHAVQTKDATGAYHYYSYTAQGQLAKEWQSVFVVQADNMTAPQAVWKAYAYDALGRQTHSYAPVQAGAESVVTLGDTQVEYNAFGEVTYKFVKQRSLAGASDEIKRYEFSEYDNAGRVWRTNAGDGVVKVSAYNLQGQQTAHLVSSADSMGAGSDSLLSKTSAQAALTERTINPGQYRLTEMRYDDLGRLTQTLEPERVTEQPMVISTRENLVYGIINPTDREGQSRIDLVWRSLEDLGSGDLRITVSYSAGAAYSKSVVVTAEEGVNGYFFLVNSYQPISAINNIKVEKLDVFANWATLLDVNTPANPTTLNWSLSPSLGYIWSEAGEGRKPIYRYYNRYNNTHLFSTNPVDHDNLLNYINGWVDEGITGYVSIAQGDNMVPLYKLHKPGVGMHMYTLSEQERSDLVRGGWYSEVDGYVNNPAGAPPAGTVLLYALKDQQALSANGVLYTTSPSEISALLGVNLPRVNAITPRTNVQLYGGAPGLSVEVSYPQDLVSSTVLEWSSVDANAWTTASNNVVQRAFGSAHRFEIGALHLAPGSYKYRITNTSPGLTRYVGEGTFTVYGAGVPDVESTPKVPGVAVGTANIDGVGYEVLKWQRPTAGWVTQFTYRPKDSNGAWSTRTVGSGVFQEGDLRTANMGANMEGVALNFGAGKFDYEILVYNPANGDSKKATGTLTMPVSPTLADTTPVIKTSNNNVQNRGIVGYVWSEFARGRTPLWRFYMPKNDHHITTADPSVVSFFQSLSSEYVHNDGIVGYVDTAPTATNKRLYQHIYGGKNVYQLTANPGADIGSYQVLTSDPNQIPGWSWNPNQWYQSAYQFDGYISSVPADGTIPLYALLDNNSKGDLATGDYLTTSIRYEATYSYLLAYDNIATAKVAGITVGKATVTGQNFNVLQWPQPEANSRVKVTVIPADPVRGAKPLIIN